MPEIDESPSTQPTPLHSDSWRKFVFTEEGVVTMLGASSTLFTYLAYDASDNSPGFASRRLMWLEPYVGEYYLSITLALLTFVMAVYTWIKHKE